MPRLGGLDLKAMINANETLVDKCLPYILYSTYMDKATVSNAYKLGVQGVFKKPSDYGEFLEIIRSLVSYWQLNYSPNRFVGAEMMLK
jgi:DNA-binding NarL/FixJ family response regulator